MATNFLIDDNKKRLICEGLIWGRGRINERKKDFKNTPIEYEHIREVLDYHRIEKIQAKNILLEMQGQFSIEIVNKIIQPVIRFLDQWQPESEGSLMIETQNLVYLFDKFINEATNIELDLKYSSVGTPNRLNNFSTEYYEPACLQTANFIKAFKREIKNIPNKEVIYIDLLNDLFPVIEKYTTWYVKNQKSLENANICHPYKLMLSVFIFAFREITKYFPEKTESVLKQISDNSSRTKNEHPQRVYGLLHFYLSETGEGEAINVENCQKIAERYKFTSLTSGTALRNEFNSLKVNTNRLNITQNPKSDKTKKHHFITVIEILEKENKTQSLLLAKDEYSIFLKKYKAQYG